MVIIFFFLIENNIVLACESRLEKLSCTQLYKEINNRHHWNKNPLQDIYKRKFIQLVQVVKSQLGGKPARFISKKILKFSEPFVTDGDTIKTGKVRIRLHGIDAPEIKQTCVLNQTTWKCGVQSRAALTKFIGHKEVSCETEEKDRYGRFIAICMAGSVNLNAMMVRKGWALAYRKYSKKYMDEELVAKTGKLGLWKGTFVPPWEWRRGKRHNFK